MDRRITNNNSIYFCYNKNKVRSQGLWNSCDDDDDDDDHEYGMMMMAWPPRSYTCSFCKREFRSAQALGGHMNVHRRDRAQLRQLTQISHNLSNPTTYHHISTTTNNTINLNFPPNPNYHMLHSPPSPPPTPAFELGTPTSTLSSSSTARRSPPLLAKPPTPSELITKKQFDCFKRHNNLLGASPNYNYDAQPKFEEGFGFKRKEQNDSLNKARGIIKLDLEMNIDVGESVFKEELDLELRLGYN